MPPISQKNDSAAYNKAIKDSNYKNTLQLKLYYKKEGIRSQGLHLTFIEMAKYFKMGGLHHTVDKNG